MERHLLLLALSATFGVAAHSSPSITQLIIITIFLCFLHFTLGLDVKAYSLHLVVMMIFLGRLPTPIIEAKPFIKGRKAGLQSHSPTSRR